MIGDIVRYYERIIEDKIKSKLTDESVVNLVGPRECGKTTVAEKFAKSVISSDEKSDSYEKLSEFKPELLLKGEKPLLIDEIEKLPILKQQIAINSKKIRDNGLYITTNYRKPKNYVEMQPMSLFESGDSTGAVKIRDLFKDPYMDIDGFESKMELDELINITRRSGFPKALENPEEIDDYVERIIRRYMVVLDGTRRDHLKAKAILKTYADHILSSTKNTDILEIIQQECPNLAKSTYYHYINCLKELYVIQEIPAWDVKIKANSTVRSVPRRAFCDPAIATSILNLSAHDLLFDLVKFEVMFKNLCIRDLKVYSAFGDGKISYYADRYGGEIDCILELSNGDYALINFNLSSQNLDNSINQLLKMDNLIYKKIEQGKLSIREPRFLAIITGSNFSYTHKKGVKIIPIGLLG